MKTLDDFKNKWKKEIEQGIISFHTHFGIDFIKADRYDDSNRTFLCSREHLNKIQSDVRKLGYSHFSIGLYKKN